MTPSARLSAAVEVLAEIAARRRPAADALKDWGLSHRFAGSGDRAAIAGLVYDTMRRKASSAYLMRDESPRATLLGMMRRERGMSADAIARLCDGGRFAPPPLSAQERVRLVENSLLDAPAHIVGDYPQWLDADFAGIFAEARAEEGAALSSRAPLDLRVNTLAGDRAKAAAALTHLAVAPTPWSRLGLRIVLAPDARNPGIHAEPAFLKGLVEVQDEGSQLAALLAGARPGQQVVDLCAGAGGKTLALAAEMDNHGQLYATDSDKRRLAPLHDRIARAGVRNVQVRTPRPGVDPLADGLQNADLVVVDAPCTGVGAWRRNPDAKWRMRPGALDLRIKEQASILDRAATLVKPGGRIAYITCSVLDAENGAQVRDFLARHRDFAAIAPGETLSVLGDAAATFGEAVLQSSEGLLMTPRRTGTDGFFVAMLARGA